MITLKKYLPITALICLMLSNVQSPAFDFEIEGLKIAPVEKKIQIIDRVVNTRNKVYLPEIAALLDDESDEIRSRAALALLTIGDSTCTPHFRKALEDSYWQVRLYGIKGLVKFGDGLLKEDFLEAMGDTYWQVRHYAALGLSKYGDETVVENIIALLTDRNEQVKERLLWALTSIMGRDEARAVFQRMSDEQIKPLLDVIKSAYPETRIRGLWALESTKDSRAVPHFVTMLADENDEVKIRALWAIDKFKADKGAKEIESLLLDSPVRVKIESIRTLVRRKMHEGAAGLVKGLEDADDSVRIYSLWALEKFRNPASYPAMTAALADESEQVREYAEKIIENIGDPLFYPILKRFIDNQDYPLDARLSALLLLGRTGAGAETRNFIIGKMADDNPLLRHSAIAAFAYLDPLDSDYIKLLAYMENHDTSPRVRRGASSALNQVMDKIEPMLASPDSSEREVALGKLDYMLHASRMPHLLLKMAGSEYPEVREKMLFLVSERPERIFAKSLRELIKEPDVRMKRLAAAGLGEIGDKSAVPALQEGINHFDPELQLACALALAKMGFKDGLHLALSYLTSINAPNQYRIESARIMGFIGDRSTSNVLLRSLADAELNLKAMSAWALARMGENKGIELLVRLSEENVEPLRTTAHRLLNDVAIPLSLRRKVPDLREQIRIEKLGIKEVSPKRVGAQKVPATIEIDGSGTNRFWRTAKRENIFIDVADERIVSEVQTFVSIGYDDSNIYFLFTCEDPDTSQLTLNSRDFITLSLNPLNAFDEWYQFVIHPFGHVKYSYVWKFHREETPASLWTSEWQAETSIENRQWMVEMSIPLADMNIEHLFPGDIWSINFQRESERFGVSAWSGRIDNPEQFGILKFEE